MIDLLKESKGRLEYNKKLLADLEEFMTNTSTDNLSKDCLQGIRSDIDKFNRNIEYYEEIIRVLEGTHGTEV